jgi:anti-anti-sigma regulatory factor
MTSAEAVAAGSEQAQVISLTGAFGPRDARELSRGVTEGIASGMRRFVVDLTDTTSVAEGPLLLALLSVRAAVRRAGGRLVVAAPEALSSRLARNLRLDRALDATGSVADALSTVTEERERA